MQDKTLLGSITSQTSEEGICTITFFHPSHNSLPGKLLAQLRDAINQASEDDAVKVVVLKSGGDRTFCAGASFDELVAIDSKENGKTFFMGFANVINAIRKCSKLVIGRVQGKAVGGGVGVAAATDYCFATKYASVKLSELVLGIGPFVIGPAVERKMGLSAMSQLGINASEFKSAAWAREKGLYTDVFDSAEEMDEAVNTLAQKLAVSNPAATRQLKTIFWHDTDHWDELLAERAAISGELVLSDFTRAALEGFKAKMG